MWKTKISYINSCKKLAKTSHIRNIYQNIRYDVEASEVATLVITHPTPNTSSAGSSGCSRIARFNWYL